MHVVYYDPNAGGYGPQRFRYYCAPFYPLKFRLSCNESEWLVPGTYVETDTIAHH